MLELTLTIFGFLILVFPMGWYLYTVSEHRPIATDALFNPIDKAIYGICGIDKSPMTWSRYALALILTNAVMLFVGYLVLRAQQFLPLNPNEIAGMEASLSFNTIISFMSNTNLQHYSGESGLSYLSQMVVIIFMMFTSAASGYAACMAFIRGISGTGKASVATSAGASTSAKAPTLGNYYVDMVRICTRVLVPVALVISLILISQGVPQTMVGTITVTTIEGTQQDIAVGPIASLVSIKHLGTNGGGFLGANSSTPQENPTVISNITELYSMMLLPGACVVVFGMMLLHKRRERKTLPNANATPVGEASLAAKSLATPREQVRSLLRQPARTTGQGQRGLPTFMGGEARTFFVAMGLLFLLGLTVCYTSELAGNPALEQAGLSQSMGSMEGKEVRLGIAQSAMFTTTTTAFTTGTVNNMHDTLTPLGGMVPLLNMMLNVVYGGCGVGFMNMAMYVLLAVFICGLMVGRTPEYLGKKVEGREMKLAMLVLILHPLLILGFSALAVSTSQGLAGISNPSFHGLSQVLYEYSSSAANNGSGFEGLGDNSLFWNLTAGLAMFYGRYVPIVLQLAIAGALLAKAPIAPGIGTLRTDTLSFAFSLFLVVLIFSALTFFPALALGPVAEHLTLWN